MFKDIKIKIDLYILLIYFFVIVVVVGGFVGISGLEKQSKEVDVIRDNRIDILVHSNGLSENVYVLKKKYYFRSLGGTTSIDLGVYGERVLNGNVEIYRDVKNVDEVIEKEQLEVVWERVD